MMFAIAVASVVSLWVFWYLWSAPRPTHTQHAHTHMLLKVWWEAAHAYPTGLALWGERNRERESEREYIFIYK